MLNLPLTQEVLELEQYASSSKADFRSDPTAASAQRGLGRCASGARSSRATDPEIIVDRIDPLFFGGPGVVVHLGEGRWAFMSTLSGKPAKRELPSCKAFSTARPIGWRRSSLCADRERMSVGQCAGRTQAHRRDATGALRPQRKIRSLADDVRNGDEIRRRTAPLSR